MYAGLDAPAQDHRAGEEELVDLRRVSKIIIHKLWLFITHDGELMTWKVNKNNLGWLLERFKEDKDAVLAVEERF